MISVQSYLTLFCISCLVKLVLNCVNFLNPKTQQVYGFSLSFLAKLRDVKGTRKGNLLRTVCKLLCSTPEYARFYTDLSQELKHLEAATRIELPELVKEIKTLKDGLAMITREVPLFEKESIDGDHFPQYLTAFSKDASVSMNCVFSSLEKTQLKLREMAQAFDENEKETVEKPHQFFKLLNGFLQDLKGEMEELEKQRLEETRKHKKKPNPQQQAEEEQSDNCKGIVDSLLPGVKDGKMVEQLREKRKMKELSVAALREISNRKQ